MDEQKTWFLARLLTSTHRDQNCTTNSVQEQHGLSHENDGGVCIEDLAWAMTDLEAKTRTCYSETFDYIDSKSFVMMMILDGCFILELLCLYDKELVDDPLFVSRWVMPILQHDLLLLENRLPFFVLQKLFVMTNDSENEHSLTKLALKFFDTLMRRVIEVLENKCQVDELTEAGIKFKERSGWPDLLDLDFQGGVLKVSLFIDDRTGPIFLNFMAFEQCNSNTEAYFTQYVIFMDSLVNLAKDVEILHYNGIINHGLGSDEEVAVLLNNLCREIVYDPDELYLSKQMMGINKESTCNEQSEADVTGNVAEIAITIKDYLTYIRGAIPQRSPVSWSIFKVLRNIRAAHENADFSSELIFISPFHIKNNRVRGGTQDKKARFLARLLTSTYRDNSCTIKDYLTYIRGAIPQRSPVSWSIFKFPRNIRAAHENADFSPELIFIGPFHIKNSRVRGGTQDKKARFLARLLTLTYRDNSCTTDRGQEQHGLSHENDRGVCIEDLALAMKDFEAKTRACYSETFDDHNSKNFVTMMIFDGCFIVELLRLYNKVFCFIEFVDDPLFAARWVMPNLQRDLLLLENQLPFFVLQKLFVMTNDSANKHSLTELALKFFDPLMCRDKEVLEKKYKVDGDHDHLLGLFRSSFLPSSKKKKINTDDKQGNPMTIYHSSKERQLVRCVTELTEARIKFKERSDHHDLLNLDFEDGVLKVPPLFIDDRTGPIFLNFVVFEQCNSNTEAYFTQYVLFLDSLVNSSKDVEILHYNGTINHCLGSDEEVAVLFNNLCREIVYDRDDLYLSKQMVDRGHQQTLQR
ncbi:hypothetical protein GIB67_030259 [Kingdonia uniflora]|uniref:Uncharacterized protein n=1 Tax=Kingdonia uniflora TaxID=39325 RepID=A0A7J7MMZ7_9MAGN|nr:hypothetical protein GIB67_030259 [Kingdonia uniflora]